MHIKNPTKEFLDKTKEEQIKEVEELIDMLMKERGDNHDN